MTEPPTNSSPIAILGAMDAEIEGYLAAMEGTQKYEWRGFTFYTGELFAVPVVVAKSGDVVEMEGSGVAFVCHLHDIPILIARTISDRANGESPGDFLKFLPRASENSLKLVQHVLGRIKEGSD